jgi:hypothetical protein
MMPDRIKFRRSFGDAQKIYGVSWTKVSSPALTRTDASVNMVATAGIDAGAVVNNFDSAEIYRDIVDVTDALGNVFVRIPRFWIEKVDTTNFKSWRISRRPFGNAYLPKCFGTDGFAYIGKYNASLSGANKLESLSGKYPLINKNIVDFRGYAQANGAGYQQFDIHAIDVLQTLFVVEFATLNSQSIMAGWTGGQYAATDTATVAENAVNRIVVANATAVPYAVGQPVSSGTSLGGDQVFYGRAITAIDIYDDLNKAIWFDGAAVNVAVGNVLYNTGWSSGFSAGIVAKSGSLVSNSDAKHPCVYRGIENPWGSIWQFVDGVNINERQAWVCPDAASYASNVFAAPYEVLSYANDATNGYIVALGYDVAHPYAAFPTAIGGSSSTYYPDYYYSLTGQKIALFGAAWAYGSSSGAFCWYLGGASSDSYVVVGGRLLRKAF